MEDKKTLLAFLIIGLILLAMPYYLEWFGLSRPAPPAQPAPELPAQPDEPTGSSRPLSQEGKPSPDSQLRSQSAEIRASLLDPKQKQGFTPRDIIVQTPLQKLVFSTEGGIIVSVQLLQFNQRGNQKVEIVPPGGRGLVMRLKYRETLQDFSEIEFIPDQDGIQINAEEEARLTLRAQLGEGQYLEKVIHFFGDRYGLEVELRYAGLPEGSEVFLGWEGGIASTENHPQTDLADMRALAYMNEELTPYVVKDKGQQPWNEKGALKWAGLRNKYFFTAIAPQEGVQYRIKLAGELLKDQLHSYSYEIGIPIGETGQWKALMYLGPLDYEELSQYREELEMAMDLGWPVVREVSKLLLIVFVAAHTYIPNYGVVIILFAAVVKLLVYPLTRKSYESASRMQDLQPKLVELREKYKNDSQRLSRETMKLYKEEGVNPLGGCLPLVLQMPIFFALYRVFSSTIALRQAPFFLWITDLSVPDEVQIAGFGLHILPLLMAGSMLIQQKMTMKDPKQAFMVYTMPLIMIFFFWNLSSGLVLYWTVFNLFTIVHQGLIDYFKRATRQPMVLVGERK